MQQTTPMAYATQTKTSRRKSLSHKQFGLSPTHAAGPSMEKALQNLGQKTALSATFGEHAEREEYIYQPIATPANGPW